MKTYDVYKIVIEENPNKKFRRKSDGKIYGYTEGNGLRPVDKLQGFYHVWPGEEWEEVKEPLGLIEMLKKVEGNGDVGIDLDDFEEGLMYVDLELNDILLDISRTYSNTVIAEMLLKAKFYIRD